MIPNKNASDRFSAIGTRARGTGLTGSQIRTKANGYQAEILSLKNGARTTDWADSVKKLEKKISAEPLEVRYAISNLGVLTSLSTEAGRIKRNARTTTTRPTSTTTTTRPTSTTTTTRPTSTTTTTRPTPPPPQPRPVPRPTNTPTPRPTQTQNSGGPTVQPTTTPKEPFDISTLWFSVILFNIPTVIFLFLAFTFQGWFNVWLGFAILWFIAAITFTILGTVYDEESPAPPDFEKIALSIGIALPIVAMLVFMWCLFVSGMIATAIFSWIGAILSAFFMSCSASGKTSKVCIPAFLATMLLDAIFTIGVFVMCYFFNAGWATWIFGIIALLVHFVFGPLGIEYINADKTGIPFIYIPAYIAFIIAVANSDANAYTVASIITLISVIITVIWAKKE